MSGRYYPMDRDKRWERVALGYDAIVEARGETASTPAEAIDRGYAAGLDDEFVKPTVIDGSIDGYRGMQDGDGLLMFNFPLLALWDRDATLLGLPLFPAALFLIWALLIAVLGLISEGLGD